MHAMQKKKGSPQASRNVCNEMVDPDPVNTKKAQRNKAYGLPYTDTDKCSSLRKSSSNSFSF